MNLLSIEDEISLFGDKEFYTNDETKFKLETTSEDGDLIKSKERVQHHGEVFTPKWMVEKMLAEPSIQEKIHDLHATFLEPSAGEGAFLKEILHQKLNYVDQISNKSNWKDNALWALMSIYAIELLRDNLVKARSAMLEIFINHYQAFTQSKLSNKTDLFKSVKFVIETNIVQGNTLTYLNDEGKIIEFSDWQPSDGNKVLRSSFTYKSLFNNGDIDDVNANEGQLSLFDELDNEEESYSPTIITKVYKQE
nr:methylase [Ligilactobacillus ruminis]